MNSRFLLIFLASTFGFSWGLWGLVILSSSGLLPIHVPLNPWGSFGPAIGALIATGLQQGKKGIRSLLSSLVRARMPVKWYLFSLLSPAALAISAVLAWMIIEGKIVTPHLQQWYLVFPVALLILILGGPLGEEIGWRGYLLPELQKRYSPLAAALITGLFWLLWHLPLFWMKGSSQYDVSIAPYALWIFTMSVIFTWLYNRTNGSLLQAVLYHTAINVTYFCIPYVFPEADASKLFHYFFLGASAIVALVVTAGFSRHKGKAGFSLRAWNNDNQPVS